MDDEKTNSHNLDSLDDEEEISFEEGFRRTVLKLRPHIQSLWKNRKKFILFNAAIGVVTVLVLLLLVKNYYVSTITILPDYGAKESTLSQLSGLASLAGVSVGQGTPTDVYENLITCEAVVAPVIYAKYKTDKYPDSVNLVQYLKVRPDKSLPPDLRKRDMFLKAYKAIVKGNISTNMDRMSKILTVSAKMPEAALSAEVVNKLVESLDNYIRTKRKSYASDQLTYIEERMGQVSDSLRIAEDRLRDFREQNRMVIQSPELMLIQERLTRNVDILGSVYLELRKQYELAKIDVIKDTPIVNVRDYAKDPVVKAGPKKLVTLIIILFLSGLFSGLYFMFKTSVRKYAGYVKGNGLTEDGEGLDVSEAPMGLPEEKRN